MDKPRVKFPISCEIGYKIDHQKIPSAKYGSLAIAEVLGQKAPAAVGGMFAIRDGDWKLVLGNGSGGREKPRGKPFERPYFLANLAEDPAEATNRAKQQPEVVGRLEEFALGCEDCDREEASVRNQRAVQHSCASSNPSIGFVYCCAVGFLGTTNTKFVYASIF